MKSKKKANRSPNEKLPYRRIKENMEETTVKKCIVVTLLISFLLFWICSVEHRLNLQDLSIKKNKEFTFKVLKKVNAVK